MINNQSEKNTLNTLSVLLCDADDHYRSRLTDMLTADQTHKFQVRGAADASQIETALLHQIPDIVILDMGFSDKSSMDWLKEITLKELAPVIIIADNGGEQVAVDTMKNGAFDYLGKSYLNRENLIQSLIDAREKWNIIRETEELQAELAHMAMYDTLSMVLSRRAILEHLEVEIQRTRRYDRSLSLMMVDIDMFKKVNDTHGHLAGDAVIHEIAQSLKTHVRRSDFVGRYGGEEFLVVLPETSLEQALPLAEKLRAHVTKLTMPVDGKVISNITVSIGVASFDDDSGVEAFIGRSDVWMYKAKELGRNQVQPELPKQS